MSERRVMRGSIQVGRAVGRIAAEHGILRPFERQDSLVDGGMTSIAMVDLMLAVEHDFGLIIPDHELTPANFASIDSIAAMVERLSSRASNLDATIFIPHPTGSRT